MTRTEYRVFYDGLDGWFAAPLGWTSRLRVGPFKERWQAELAADLRAEVWHAPEGGYRVHVGSPPAPCDHRHRTLKGARRCAVRTVLDSALAADREVS